MWVILSHAVRGMQADADCAILSERRRKEACHTNIDGVRLVRPPVLWNVPNMSDSRDAGGEPATP